MGTASKSVRIGLRDVKALPSGSEIRDTEVKGFTARRQKGTQVTYCLYYRTKDGRQRRYTIGIHGSPFTPEMARDKARALLVEVKEGADPAAEKKEARDAATVAELCDDYLSDLEAGRIITRRGQSKAASTITTDRGRIVQHIKPLLGNLPVASVTSRDVEQFMLSVAEGKSAKRVATGKKRGLSNVRGGRGTASRTIGLLGAIFTYAQRRGLRGDNPVRGVRRWADDNDTRRLATAEYAAFGKALRKAEAAGIWSAAIGAAKFLLLTGWRSGEVLSLRRSYVDLERRTAWLPHTKSGKSTRALSEAACEVLRAFPGPANGLFFPASRGKGAMSGFRSIWDRIMALGGLPADVTPKVLRHSFASLGADMGRSEAVIGALVGHKGHSITSRYLHPADEALVAAADAVAGRIAELMATTAADDEDASQPAAEAVATEKAAAGDKAAKAAPKRSTARRGASPGRRQRVTHEAKQPVPAATR
jgi:integrase